MPELVQTYHIEGISLEGDGGLPPVEKGFFNLKPALKHVRFATTTEIRTSASSILAALKSVRVSGEVGCCMRADHFFPARLEHAMLT